MIYEDLLSDLWKYSKRFSGTMSSKPYLTNLGLWTQAFTEKGFTHNNRQEIQPT